MVVIQLSSQDVLPCELVDLIIAIVASNCDGIYNVRQRRHDLASCGLVCRAFYLPSRRYLFENMTLITKHGERESQSLKKLREILSTGPMLRFQIYHLVIADKTPSGYTGWKRPGRTLLGEENLPHILRLLPSLRSLTISAVQDVYWTLLTGELVSALRLRDVPIGFVHQWDVTTIRVDTFRTHDNDFIHYASPFSESKSPWLQAWILIIRTSKSLIVYLCIFYSVAHLLYLSNGHPSPKYPFEDPIILLTIDLFRDQEEAFLQAASQPAWALLDNACTNAQLYRDLEKRAILDVLEDCAARLLPLLSSSARVSFLHMQRIRWHNG
ncbi:hypothetical protein BJ912DRAFT_1001023, partial [Pholiota molesta]